MVPVQPAEAPAQPVKALPPPSKGGRRRKRKKKKEEQSAPALVELPPSRQPSGLVTDRAARRTDILKKAALARGATNILNPVVAALEIEIDAGRDVQVSAAQRHPATLAHIHKEKKKDKAGKKTRQCDIGTEIAGRLVTGVAPRFGMAILVTILLTVYAVLLAQTYSFVDSSPVSSVSSSSLSDTASNYDCARVQLFKHMLQFVMFAWVLTLLLSRIQHGHVRRFRRLPARRMVVPLTATLCLAMVTSRFMQPPHCACTGDQRRSSTSMHQLRPFCKVGVPDEFLGSATSARRPIQGFANDTKDKRFWRAEMYPTTETTCNITFSKTSTTRESQKCTHDMPKINVPEVCYSRDSGIQAYARTKTNISSGVALATISFLGYVDELLGIDNSIFDDVLLEERRDWAVGNCSEQNFDEKFANGEMECPFDPDSKTEFPVNARGQLLIQDILKSIMCNSLYDFCDPNTQTAMPPCSDHICCMVYAFKKAFSACDPDVVYYLFQDYGSLNQDALTESQMLEYARDLESYMPDKTVHAGIVATLRFLVGLIPKDVSNEGLEKFFSESPCHGIDGLHFLQKAPYCLRAKDRSNFRLPPYAANGTESEIDCPCANDVKVWQNTILALVVTTYTAATAALVFTTFVHCMPGSAPTTSGSEHHRREVTPTCVPWCWSPYRSRHHPSLTETLATGVPLCLLFILATLTMDKADSISRSGDVSYAQRNFSEDSRNSKIAASNASAAVSIAAILTAVVSMLIIDSWVSLPDDVEQHESRKAKGDCATLERSDASTGRSESDSQKSCAARFWSSFSVLIARGTSLKREYDDLFSYETGRYYLERQLVMEAIEIGNQIYQLATFSHLRTKAWVLGLSTLVLMNGVAIPVPPLLTTFARGSRSKAKVRAKVLTAILDTTFDLGYFVVALIAIDTSSDLDEGAFLDSGTWFTAAVGLIVPAFGMLLTLDDVTEAARNSARDRLRWYKFGGQQKRRSSMFVLEIPEVTATDGPIVDKPVTRKTGKIHRNLDQSAVVKHAHLVITAALGLVCIATASVFLGIASSGDRACQDLLGPELWQGASPKVVVLPDFAVGCNTTVIRKISTSRVPNSRTLPLTALPEGLSMLRNLRSLVVKNHNISSRGVRPLVELSALTRLELSGQVESAVDMSGIRNMTSMPSFLFDFMSESLEELYFEGTSVDGLDPMILKAAPRLRVLDLGNTMVTYISPLFLLLSRRLEILNVKGAPVALSLNWNTSSLGAGYAKILRNDPPEMVDADDLVEIIQGSEAVAAAESASNATWRWKCGVAIKGMDPLRLQDMAIFENALLPSVLRFFPDLESFILSGNNLQYIPRGLSGFRNLKHLDLSCNHDIRGEIGAGGINWERLRRVSTLETLDMARTGMQSKDAQPAIVNRVDGTFLNEGMTCADYAWFNQSSSRMILNLTPQRGYKIVDIVGDGVTSAGNPWKSCCENASTPSGRLLERDGQVRLLRLLIKNPGTRTISVRRIADYIISSGEGSDELKNVVMTQVGLLRLLEPYKHRNFRKLEVDDRSGRGARYPSQLLGHKELRELRVEGAGWSAKFLTDVTTTLTKLTLLRAQGLALGNSSFPADLDKLKHLRSLTLGQVDVNRDFPFPSIGGLSLLKAFEITDAPMHGNASLKMVSSSIGSLRNLNTFRLIRVRVRSGTSLPASIVNMTNLRKLWVMNCPGFSGPIIRVLSTLGRGRNPPLRVDFDLSHNKFNGTVPPLAIGAAAFRAPGNRLSGMDPLLFDQSTLLVQLVLSNNQIRSSLPHGVCRAKFLCSLSLENNFIHGPLPSLGDSSQNCSGKYVRYLDFSNNNFSGAVPPSYANLSGLLCLDLCGNPLLEGLSVSRPPIVLHNDSAGMGWSPASAGSGGPLCRYGCSDKEMKKEFVDNPLQLTRCQTY